MCEKLKELYLEFVKEERSEIVDIHNIKLPILNGILLKFWNYARYDPDVMKVWKPTVKELRVIFDYNGDLKYLYFEIKCDGSDKFYVYILDQTIHHIKYNLKINVEQYEEIDCIDGDSIYPCCRFTPSIHYKLINPAINDLSEYDDI